MAKLKSNLTHIANSAPQAAAKALRRTANDIVQMAKQLAPIDTGALQRSYRVEPVSETEMIVGSDIPYAQHVEFGHSTRGGGHVGAQPHFVPAFAQNEETFKARLIEEMKAFTG